ncbi:hypothetical protein ES702_05978 [subsurface metagenome]
MANKKMIISIVSIKGGTGKTTIAFNLAGALSKPGKVVLIKDMDPQGSLRDWSKTRAKNDPGRLLHNIEITDNINEKDKSNSDYILIDTPPANDKILYDSLMQSTNIIITVTPSPIDLHSTAGTIDIIKKAMCLKNLKPYLLISRRVTGTKIGEQFREALKIFDMPIFYTEIYQRIAVCESGIEGLTIFEYEPQSLTVAEFMSLRKEILRKWEKQP